MAKNFNFEMVNGFRGTMNNVNEIAQLVKAELLNTSNVVVVNGFRFSIGGVNGYDGYALYVETTDGNPNPFDRKCYVHKIYHLGKIRRGIDKYVADFLVLNTELDMYNTPMFVWEDGKMVKYVELNNMERNNMNDMANSVEMFNEFIKDMLLNEYNDVVDSADNFAHDYGDECVDDEYVCGRMVYDYDIRKMWADWCWKNDVMNHNDAYKYYDDNNDMFICEDTLDDIVEGLDGTDDVGYGECLVWVKNPYYVEQDIVKNDSPCLDAENVGSGFGDMYWDMVSESERVADTIENYLKNYTPSYLDQFGDCVITVYWDEFNDEDMNRLIEDDNFAMSVRDSLYRRGLFEKLSDFLVYDDGVYVTVDYDRMFNKVA